jgi:hypothetical protein
MFTDKDKVIKLDVKALKIMPNESGGHLFALTSLPKLGLPAQGVSQSGRHEETSGTEEEEKSGESSPEDE